MRLKLAFVALCLFYPIRAHAQVVNPSAFTFISADQTTTIPPGQTFAGQPTLTNYQGSLFVASADVTSGVPIAVGPVVAKNLAVAVTGSPANTYKLLLSQLGLSTPPCANTPCTQYTVVLVAIGPNGSSLKGGASESDPFTAAIPIQGPPPAAPTNVHPVP